MHIHVYENKLCKAALYAYYLWQLAINITFSVAINYTKKQFFDTVQEKKTTSSSVTRISYYDYSLNMVIQLCGKGNAKITEALSAFTVSIKIMFGKCCLYTE